MNNFEIKKPFGPSVAKITLNQNIIESMNDYVEKIINNKKKSQLLDHGDQLAGKVSQEFLLEDEFMIKIKWAELLGATVQKWIQTDNNYYSSGHILADFGNIST